MLLGQAAVRNSLSKCTSESRWGSRCGFEAADMKSLVHAQGSVRIRHINQWIRIYQRSRSICLEILTPWFCRTDLWAEPSGAVHRDCGGGWQQPEPIPLPRARHTWCECSHPPMAERKSSNIQHEIIHILNDQIHWHCRYWDMTSSHYWHEGR